MIPSRPSHAGGVVALGRFCRVVGLRLRVDGHVGNELRADHCRREATQVDSGLGEILGQCSGNTRLIAPQDANAVLLLRDVEPRHGGRHHFPIALQWGHEDHPLAGLVRTAPRNDHLKVRSHIA
jgi:hypothetical protein